MRPLFLLFFFLCVLSSCYQDMGKLLPGKWDVTEFHYPDLDKFADIMGGGRTDLVTSGLVQGDFFNLHEDGSYTSLSLGTHFIYGKWRWNPADKSIWLLRTEPAKDTEILHLVNKTSDKLVLQNDTGKVKMAFKSELTLSRDRLYDKNGQDDYTSLLNNRWRIRPPKAESYQQIKERVRQNVHFAIIYLAAWMDKKETSIPLRPMLLPLYFSGNGMVSVTKINTLWSSTFFDESDATVAYSILKDAVSRSGYLRQENGTALSKKMLEDALINLQ